MRSDRPHALRPGYLLNGVKRGDPRNAPRCGASTRKGTLCQGPGMKNGRCRMHGGTSTGPKTPEGIEAICKAHMKHGRRTKAAIKGNRLLAKELAGVRKQVKESVKVFGGQWNSP